MLNNLRLMLYYGVLALFLTAAGSAVVFYVITQRQQVALAERDAKLDKLKAAYTAQSEAVATIKKGMEISDSLIVSLNNAINGVNTKSNEVRSRLDKLEKNNAVFRDYLSTHLPDGGCLLDNSCATPERPAATGGRTADPVRTSGDNTSGDKSKSRK